VHVVMDSSSLSGFETPAESFFFASLAHEDPVVMDSSSLSCDPEASRPARLLTSLERSVEIIVPTFRYGILF
jgi:hypothetical protein